MRFDQIDVHKTGSIGILEFEEQWDDPGLQALLSTLGINQAKAGSPCLASRLISRLLSNISTQLDCNESYTLI